MGRKGKRGREIIETDYILIDLKRFAYDIFAFSALKLDVPKCCIPRSLSRENDYGCSDFVSAISRVIFRSQTSIRFYCNAHFKELCKNKKPISCESVEDVWRKVYHELESRDSNYFTNLPLSLAIANELIQFLYSENSNVYLEELSQLWRDWYLHRQERFDKVGGIAELYYTGQTSEYRFDDGFNTKYIPIKFVPYADSAGNPHFYTEMKHLLEEHRREAEADESRREAEWYDSFEVMNIGEIALEIPEPHISRVRRSIPVELPVNPGLGITPHEEYQRQCGMPAHAEASPSQPEACLPKTTRHGRRLSSRELHESIKRGLHSGVKRSPKKSSADSSPAELPSEKKQSVSETHHVPPSLNIPGAITKKPSRHARESSGEQKSPKSKYSSLPSMEPAITQLSLNSPEDEEPSGSKPSATETQHETLSHSGTGTIPKDSAINPQRSSGKIKGKDGSCPSVEQAVARLSLNSPEGEQSSENRPSVSGKHRDKDTGAIPKDPTRHPVGSSGKRGNQRSMHSSSPSFEQGLSRSSLGSKQSNEKEPTQRITPSQNVPTTSPQEPGKKHSQSSSQKKRQKKKSR